MAMELIFTSAKKGLRANTEGFCTVAMTNGMPSPLVERLEKLAGYRSLYPLGSGREKQNPPLYGHYKLTVGGMVYDVLTRIVFAGADYFGGSNKLAHHIVLEPHEQCPEGPAWAMMQPGLFRDQWTGEPELLPPIQMLSSTDPVNTSICDFWKQYAGDSGWAGEMVQQFLLDAAKPSYVIYDPEVDALRLIYEALRLLPASDRWRVTFNTYYDSLPVGQECSWRCCAVGSKGAGAASSKARGVYIDLTGVLKKAPDHHYSQLARGSSMETDPSISPQAPVPERRVMLDTEPTPSWTPEPELLNVTETEDVFPLAGTPNSPRTPTHSPVMPNSSPKRLWWIILLVVAVLWPVIAFLIFTPTSTPSEMEIQANEEQREKLQQDNVDLAKKAKQQTQKIADLKKRQTLDLRSLKIAQKENEGLKSQIKDFQEANPLVSKSNPEPNQENKPEQKADSPELAAKKPNPKDTTKNPPPSKASTPPEDKVVKGTQICKNGLGKPVGVSEVAKIKASDPIVIGPTGGNALEEMVLHFPYESTESNKMREINANKMGKDEKRETTRGNIRYQRGKMYVDTSEGQKCIGQLSIEGNMFVWTWIEQRGLKKKSMLWLNDAAKYMSVINLDSKKPFLQYQFLEPKKDIKLEITSWEKNSNSSSLGEECPNGMSFQVRIKPIPQGYKMIEEGKLLQTPAGNTIKFWIEKDKIKASVVRKDIQPEYKKFFQEKIRNPDLRVICDTFFADKYVKYGLFFKRAHQVNIEDLKTIQTRSKEIRMDKLSYEEIVTVKGREEKRKREVKCGSKTKEMRKKFENIIQRAILATKTEKRLSEKNIVAVQQAFEAWHHEARSPHINRKGKPKDNPHSRRSLNVIDREFRSVKRMKIRDHLAKDARNICAKEKEFRRWDAERTALDISIPIRICVEHSEVSLGEGALKIKMKK